MFSKKGFNFFNKLPKNATENRLKKYADAATSALPPKIIAENQANTADFAPQGIIGARNIVIRLSLSFSIVREAIIPVTAHPQETVSGNNDFPDRPNFRNTLSRINATRAA